MGKSTKSNLPLLSFKANRKPQNGKNMNIPKYLDTNYGQDSKPVKGSFTSDIIAEAGSTTSDWVENGWHMWLK